MMDEPNDSGFFFGTPEVEFRPTRRFGADGAGYTPGFSTGKKLRENMSFSSCSPASVRRKPFHDVTNSSLQTASPAGSHADNSMLLSAQKDTDHLRQHSPGFETSLRSLDRTSSAEEMKFEDLSCTPADKATSHLLAALQQSGAECASPTRPLIGGTTSSPSENHNTCSSGTKDSLYKRIIQEATFALPRTPTALRRAELPPSEPSEQDTSHPSAPSCAASSTQDFHTSITAPTTEPRRSITCPEEDCDARSAATELNSSAGKFDRATAIKDRGRGGAETSRLMHLELELAKEKTLRAELQEKLLKSVESVLSLGSHRHGGGAGCEVDVAGNRHAGICSSDSVTAGEERDSAREMVAEEAVRAGGGALAYVKELDLLRSQLETQDKVIDMLCKKIPCKDVLDALGSSGSRARDVPRVMHPIVEESPSASSSSSPAPSMPGTLSPSTTLNSTTAAVSFLHDDADYDAAVSIRSTAFGLPEASDYGKGAGRLVCVGGTTSGCEASGRGGDGGALTSEGEAESHRDSLNMSTEEANDMAFDMVRSSLQVIHTSLDRALRATSVPEVGWAQPRSPLALGQPTAAGTRQHASRAQSLSPDVSSLTTVVRLAKEVQTLRQKHEGNQRLVERAAAECSSLSSRCSKLEREKSSLSASFQRLTDTLSQSLADTSVDGQWLVERAPCALSQSSKGAAGGGMSTLAQLLEQARLELQELQEEDSMNSSMSAEKTFPTLSPSSSVAECLSPAKSCDKSLEELEDEWDMGEEGDDAGVDVGHGSLLLSRTKNRPLRCATAAAAATCSAMDVTEEWYQSWYEPEGDDSILASPLRMSKIGGCHEDVLSRSTRNPNAHTNAALWEVQEVSGMGAHAQGKSTVMMCPASTSAIECPQARQGLVVDTLLAVASGMGKVLYIVLSVCLHLLSLSIVIIGVAVSVCVSSRLYMWPVICMPWRVKLLLCAFPLCGSGPRGGGRQ